MRRLLPLLAVVLASPSIASGHAFGQRYDLPIPLHFFLFGAAIVLVYTFLSLSFSIQKPTVRKERLIGAVPKWLRSPGSLTAGFFLLLTYFTAAFGSSSPTDNFAPTFFWVLFWIGIPLSAIFFGNFWEHLNPMQSVARFLEKKLTTKPYPGRWGIYPALAVYMIFTWLELVSGTAYFPHTLALILTGYVTWLLMGSVLFGTTWIRQADFFSVLSRMAGSLSAFNWSRGKVFLRSPGVGALQLNTKIPGVMPFVIFFISGVTYDGFRETETWRQLFTPAELPLSPTLLGTLELLGLFLLMLGMYTGFIALVRVFSRTSKPVTQLARVFVGSLIPVAAAYTLAHYFSYFVTTGQDVIRLASDPFGVGWNLFHTREYAANISIVPLKQLWYAQVAIVLVGHALGLYLAHKIALREFRNPRLVMRSQLPMLLLMIGLTCLALWILHAPLGIE